MQFYEKLIFLLNLTQSTNRMLAHELQVDPSLISRLRTGTRGIPRNREHIKAMSSYFAKRCTTEYQRQALSGMLGIRQAFTMKKEQLSEILYHWLCGESDEIGRFIRTSESITVSAVTPGNTIPPLNATADNTAYYGNEGKRAAARAIYHHLLSLKKPCTIYIMADEADNWISEDYEFSQELQSWGMNLTSRGFHLCHIAPPAYPVDLAFDSLLRWIPFYMTGHATAYYYPRLRDNVYQRTLLVVPGNIAMFSNSLAHQTTGTAAIVTTDKRLIQACSVQFQDYLSLCRPMLNIYTEPESLRHCFTRFLSTEGARIQKVTTLSAETTPPELMYLCTGKFTRTGLKMLGSPYLHNMVQIEEHKDISEFIDIAYLASAQEVRNGNVPIILSYGKGSSPLCYTPETYVMHLKNILHIMDIYDNYHFVPIGKEMEKDGTILIKEGQRALLVHFAPLPNNAAISVFEIVQPEIVQLCREHLLRIAEHIGYAGVNRSKIISQIKKRISELQE